MGHCQIFFMKSNHQIMQEFKIPCISIFLILLHINISLAQTKEQIPFLQTLEPHKSIYISHSWLLNDEGAEQGYRNDELLIQFSFKKNLFYEFYFGYTQKSFWQLYDHGNSRSFREHSYNPEFFYDLEEFWQFDLVRLGIWEHESNGDKERFNENYEPVNYSRTWNRSYLMALESFFEDFLELSVKLWTVNDREDDEYGSFYDDNPDIQQYLGSGEVYVNFKAGPAKVNVLIRKGWKSGTETIGFEGFLPFTYLKIPVEGVDLYLQYFNGYGESLIDYDRRVKRFSIGFSVN